jgi:hypothetical protein
VAGSFGIIGRRRDCRLGAWGSWPCSAVDGVAAAAVVIICLCDCLFLLRDCDLGAVGSLACAAPGGIGASVCAKAEASTWVSVVLASVSRRHSSFIAGGRGDGAAPDVWPEPYLVRAYACLGCALSLQSALVCCGFAPGCTTHREAGARTSLRTAISAAGVAAVAVAEVATGRGAGWCPGACRFGQRRRKQRAPCGHVTGSCFFFFSSVGSSREVARRFGA